MAYRRVAKMFYDRDPNKFKHLLIFGGGTFDNRHAIPTLSHMNYDNTMLTYQCRDIGKQVSAETNFTNDNYFGVLTDQYGYDSNGNAKATESIYTANYYPQVVNVGRIPAMDITEAKNYVDKVERVLSGVTPIGAFTKYIFASDDGDADSHAKAAEEITATYNSLQPNITTITTMLQPPETDLYLPITPVPDFSSTPDTVEPTLSPQKTSGTEFSFNPANTTILQLHTLPLVPPLLLTSKTIT